MGLKTGENQRVLFTDEYIGKILKLFIAFKLLEKLPLQTRVLEGEGVGCLRGFGPLTSLTAHSLISIVQPERVIFCKRIEAAGERTWPPTLSTMRL